MGFEYVLHAVFHEHYHCHCHYVYWTLYAITVETLFFSLSLSRNVSKRDSFLVNNAHFSRFVQMKGCKCVPTETVDTVAWCAGTFWLASIYCSICFSNNKFAFDNLSSCFIFTVFVYTICGSKYAPYIYSKRM